MTFTDKYYIEAVEEIERYWQTLDMGTEKTAIQEALTLLWSTVRKDRSEMEVK